MAWPKAPFRPATATIGLYGEDMIYDLVEYVLVDRKDIKWRKWPAFVDDCRAILSRLNIHTI